MTNNTNKSRQLVETLRDGESLFLSLVDCMVDAVAIIDWDGTILFVNKAGANLVGLESPGDVIGLNALEFAHSDFRTLIINDLLLVKNGKRGSLADYRIYNLRTRTGGDKWVEAIGTMVYFGGNTADLVTFRDITLRRQMEEELRKHRNYLEKLVEERTAELQITNDKLNLDITERKRIERALRESHEKYRIFIESLPQVVFETDEEGAINLVNHKAFETFGYTQEDIEKGLNIFQMITPEERERAKERIERLLSGEGLRAGEYIGLRKDGGTLPIVVHLCPLVCDNKIVGMRGIAADITEMRKTQDALRESDHKYRELVENLNDTIYSADLRGMITYSSPPIKSLIGYNHTEVIGRSFTEFIHSEDLPRIEKQFEKIISDIIEPSEYRMVTRFGETRWVRSSSRAIYRGDRVIGIQGVITDITERKHAEEVLDKREEDLVNKSRMLEEADTALRVLLKRREEDKEELEEKVSANIKELVIPYIEMLKKNQLDSRNIACLSILDSNLKNVISPFCQKLSSKYLNLTPKEIQVSNLIKAGRTSKEIAEVLNVATSSIDFHRYNIRNKFGLNHKKISLRSYLLSFS
jgi:PAS domain S-box-containing protein